MRYMSTYQEAQFRQSVDRALERVKQILDATRHPRLAHQDEEQHTYDDKFSLAEFLVNTSIAAKMNALERLGLSSDGLNTVNQWVHKDNQSVTLRMQAEDFCIFVKDRMVEVPPNEERQHETTTTTTSGGSSFLGISTGQKTETVKTSVTTKIKEHHWKVGLTYRLILFKGSDPGDSIELQTRTTSTLLITSGGKGRGTPTSPIAEKTIHPPIDANLTWFFQRISPTEQNCQFVIERNSIKSKKTCKTPRRNQDVDEAVDFDRRLYNFCRGVINFFLDRVEADIANKHNPVVTPEKDGGKQQQLPTNSIAIITGLQKEPTFNGNHVKIVEYLLEQQRYRVDPVDPSAGLPATLLIKPQNLQASKEPSPKQQAKQVPQKAPPLNELDQSAIFAPALPLLEGGTILSGADVAAFLGEQTRSMDEALENLSKTYPPRQLMKLVSVAEASVVLICQHLAHLTEQCHESLDYVEDMLKQQLVQAIGKEVVSKDFEQFMRYRGQQIFGKDYAPQPFSYAIRRPNHFPDGMLSIETSSSAATTTTTTPGDTEKIHEPIETWSRRISGGSPFQLSINAATSVQLGGDRCLHGWLQHRFRYRTRPSFQLVARARQFSSFLLMVGTIAGPDRFECKDAIILQNKDQILIPLLTNTLPSAKEFKDAIVSLSPEQQEFAKAFRAMQLESSVFAVCVVQLKPQLERLLGLPDGALTKEIQLTQDLMSLFIEYQIPSDLLTFEGSEGSAADKVLAVKGYVKAVLDVIENEKKKQLEQEVMVSDMKAELAFSAGLPVDAHYGGAAAPESLMDTSGADLMQEESERSAASGGSRKGGRGSRRLKKAGFPTMMAAAPPRRALLAGGLAPAAPEAAPRSQRSSRRLNQDKNGRHGKPRQVSPTPLTIRTELVQPTPSGKTGEAGDVLAQSGGEDFTTIPKILDRKLESFDTDNALRSTIIKASQNWTRLRQQNLLTPIASSSLNASDIDTERKKAFDLLDAISRSGTLPIDCAELHVVVSLSHCFENDVMGTIIQDNINPIEKVEKSSLLLASTILDKPPASILAGSGEVERLTGAFPELLSSASDEAVEIYQD